MSYQKCPACDGYGNRPHRTKPNKRAKCKACKGGGIVGYPDSLTWTQPTWIIPQVETCPVCGRVNCNELHITCCAATTTTVVVNNDETQEAVRRMAESMYSCATLPNYLRHS